MRHPNYFASQISLIHRAYAEGMVRYPLYVARFFRLWARVEQSFGRFDQRGPDGSLSYAQWGGLMEVLRQADPPTVEHPITVGDRVRSHYRAPWTGTVIGSYVTSDGRGRLDHRIVFVRVERDRHNRLVQSFRIQTLDPSWLTKV